MSQNDTKIDHFRNILCSESLSTVLKKLNLTQEEWTCTNKPKTQLNRKKTKARFGCLVRRPPWKCIVPLLQLPGPHWTFIYLNFATFPTNFPNCTANNVSTNMPLIQSSVTVSIMYKIYRSLTHKHKCLSSSKYAGNSLDF